MTVLHWVRHGPTHAKTMIGWTDRAADLSDLDRIARLNAYLPEAAQVISSDLTRAVTTADTLASPTRPRLPHDASLREIHFGAWEDRRFDDISATDPDGIKAFWEQPGPTRAPGGEGWDDLTNRVNTVADRLAAQGGEYIVVAHFGAILTQIQRARGQSTTEVFAQTVDPLSVTRLRWLGGRWIEEVANHCP